MQCKFADKSISVCSMHKANDTWYVLNPWLGGAFNVYERSADGTEGGCDTTALDYSTRNWQAAGITIDATCPVDPVCEDDPLLPTTATVCQLRQGLAPKLDTVPRSSPHNMCARDPPANPLSCQHKQGMLYGLKVLLLSSPGSLPLFLSS